MGKLLRRAFRQGDRAKAAITWLQDRIDAAVERQQVPEGVLEDDEFSFEPFGPPVLECYRKGMLTHYFDRVQLLGKEVR